MNIKNLADIEPEFIHRAHSIVWCSAATVDERGRPRSRILHPIWEGSVGWIGTFRNSPKSQDLARNPYVSLAYVADTLKPVYVDCLTEWGDDMATKQHVWHLFKEAAPPLGYDPAMTFTRVDLPNFGVLRLTPWRIQLTDLGQQPYSMVWEAQEA